MGTLIEDPSIDRGNLNWSRKSKLIQGSHWFEEQSTSEKPSIDRDTNQWSRDRDWPTKYKQSCTRIEKFLQRQRAQIRILSSLNMAFSSLLWLLWNTSSAVTSHLGTSIAISPPLIEEWSPSIVCSYWSIISATYVCSPTSIHHLSQYPRHFQLKCFRRLLGLKLLILQCQPFSDATATSSSQTLSSEFSHTRLQSQAEYHPLGIDDESAKTVVSAELRQMEEWKNGGISGMEELIQWCWSLDMSIASVHRNIDNRTSIWFQLK